MFTDFMANMLANCRLFKHCEDIGQHQHFFESCFWSPVEFKSNIYFPRDCFVSFNSQLHYKLNTVNKVIEKERLCYLFSSMHQCCGAVLLSSIHLHPLLYQQPEDVILPPCCCQHAQGHTTDILWTEKYKTTMSQMKEVK